MRIVTVVGNPRPESRTRTIAEALAARVAARTASDPAPTVDLCNLAEHLFRWPADEVVPAMESVAAADVLIVASPTYKAAYTGLLKAFLDRFGANALRGAVAVPVMTVEDPRHALAVEFTLRPLLVELGARLPTRGLAFVMADLERMDEVIDEWMTANAMALPGTPGTRTRP